MVDINVRLRSLSEDDMKESLYTDYEVWKLDKAVYDPGKRVMEFDVNVVEKILCWRLVHNGVATLNLFKSDGETSTIYSLFVGSEKECLDEAGRLGLERPEFNELGEKNSFPNSSVNIV